VLLRGARALELLLMAGGGEGGLPEDKGIGHGDEEEEYQAGDVSSGGCHGLLVRRFDPVVVCGRVGWKE